MGVQRFGTKEKIGTLTNLGASVQLGPSRITIGGQQYITSSNLTVAYPAMAANTVYMIYAVQTAGVVSIVISTNLNSVGPSGFSSWKLVGAFVTNFDAATFDRFYTIKGLPQNRTLIKVLPSDVGTSTNPLTALTLNNLKVGFVYRIQITGSLVNGGATQQLSLIHNSSIRLRMQDKTDANGNEDRSVNCNEIIMTAEVSTVTFQYVNVDGVGNLDGTNSTVGTFVLLEELNNYNYRAPLEDL